MRRVLREELPARATSYLSQKQRELQKGGDARKKWESARKTKTLKGIAAQLAKMSGPRERCMFCGDSRGTDIDHFWPIVPYGERTFVWNNLLWVCSACNKKKGNRFDLDSHGSPLLIDPTTDEPWDCLFYDSRTGIITARYHLETGLPNPKGGHTTHPDVLPLNVEAVTDGRQRIARNIKRAIRTFLSDRQKDEQAFNDLVETLHDNDDFGLVEWFLHRDGNRDPPMRHLANGHPAIWQRLTSAF